MKRRHLFLTPRIPPQSREKAHNLMFDQEELDTSLVARKTLHFMRSNGLTVTEFSEKVRFISHYLFLNLFYSIVFGL